MEERKNEKTLWNRVKSGAKTGLKIAGAVALGVITEKHFGVYDKCKNGAGKVSNRIRGNRGNENPQGNAEERPQYQNNNNPRYNNNGGGFNNNRK